MAITWTVHVCENPYDVRTVESKDYYVQIGKCAECHQEWVFGVIMKSAVKFLKELKVETR